MKILGIETSCDETGASVIEDGVKILSNIVASSQPIHIKTGGIIPEIAAREQIKLILPVIESALKKEGLKIENVDALAVTSGPGLVGSLLVGLETAKTLAHVFNKPIIPVNHLLGHVYTNWITKSKIKNQNLPEFPAIVLIVSGGHTELLLMTDHGQYEWLGATRDDAAGECFDKCARLLKLGYPGGPAIAVAAAKLKIQNAKFKIKLPRPMLKSDDFDFSFSGLKTAVLREIERQSITHNPKLITYLAHEIQEAITDVLVAKTLRAVKKYKVKSVLLSGGVAANDRLREKFLDTCYSLPTTKFFAPPKNLCTDNAAGIAACAFFNFSPLPWPELRALSSLTL
ncbi:MAG: tRNA (adenosine(37)-N6)-threonylcarbamoyltransferase complex transferase subunit TsaD [Patescibacteria group bacterium]|nr:tRNA (adenosine(37)-N6)-threonylcarbamoyltransferase complex transferase subunit TsaD [Patescibacteria group bacterium]